MRRSTFLGVLALAPLAISCASSHDVLIPALRTPPAAQALDLWQKSREMLAVGDVAAAEAALREAIAADPKFVRAHRALQDLMIAQMRRSEAMEEAERAVEREPRSAQALYLLSRLRNGEARRELIHRALAADPSFGWSYLGLSGLAESFEEPGAGVEFARLAALVLPLEVEPLLAWVRQSAQIGFRPETEREWHARAEGLDADSAAASAELALRFQVFRDVRFPHFPVDELVEKHGEQLLRTAGGCEVLAAAAQRGLGRKSSTTIALRLEEARRKPRSAALAAEQAALAATLAAVQGRTAAARLEWERAYKNGDRTFATLRALRSARFRDGDFSGALALYREWVLPMLEVLPQPSARERARAELGALEAAVARAAVVPKSAAAKLELARRLLAAGWTEEAAECAAAARPIATEPSVLEECDSLLREARGFRALVAFLRDELRAPAGGGEASGLLRASLEPLARESRALIGRDVVEGSRTEIHFPVGALIGAHPGEPGIVSYFEALGYELRLGKRFFGPVEGFSVRRAGESTLSGTVLGRRYEGRLALGEASSLHTRLEALGARFGGATLPESVLLVLDAASDLAAAYDHERAWLDHDRASGRGALPAQRLPRVEAARRAAADEVGDAPRRLIRRALLRDGSPLAPRVLALVLCHELGHLADATEYVPVLPHIPRVISWLIEAGFSMSTIEGRLEKRAELTALVEGADPEIVLAEILEACEEPAARPPHSIGFADLGREFVEEAHERSVSGSLRLHPGLAWDEGAATAPQLWKLAVEEIRDIGRVLADREGILRGAAPAATSTMPMGKP
ncbi:MAG: hypothetical protein JNJ88_07510 [Planctomycetes bacterium]|nr:hypothetical protein [Planctomycetota bacterium]